LFSAFLAAGIDNVSTLLFRDETFCNRREIKSELIDNSGRKVDVYLIRKSVTHIQKEKESKQQIIILRRGL